VSELCLGVSCKFWVLIPFFLLNIMGHRSPAFFREKKIGEGVIMRGSKKRCFQKKMFSSLPLYLVSTATILSEKKECRGGMF